MLSILVYVYMTPAYGRSLRTGILDTYLPYYDGPPTFSAFEDWNRLPAEETMEGWIEQAGGDVNNFEISNIGYAVRYHYPLTNIDGAEVEFWVLEVGGHTWPGGRTTLIEDRLGVGPINEDINASEVIWEFF